MRRKWRHDLHRICRGIMHAGAEGPSDRMDGKDLCQTHLHDAGQRPAHASPPPDVDNLRDDFEHGFDIMIRDVRRSWDGGPETTIVTRATSPRINSGRRTLTMSDVRRWTSDVQRQARAPL